MSDAHDRAREDLVDANHILVNQRILDAFGHVSVRDPDDHGHFLLARNMAPGQVTAGDLQRFDLDAETDDPRPSYLERFIHSEIYRARPDVMSVVHSHSMSVLPFGLTDVPLRAVSHMAGFLGDAVPVFEIRDVAGDSSTLLIENRGLGTALARTLGDGWVALMRGHGSVAVGPSLHLAVHRAVYTEMNARVQAQAHVLGEVTALTAGEARAAQDANDKQVQRAWNVWRDTARSARNETA